MTAAPAILYEHARALLHTYTHTHGHKYERPMMRIRGEVNNDADVKVPTCVYIYPVLSHKQNTT